MRPIVNGLQVKYEEQMAFDAVDAATESGDALLKTYRLRGHPSYAILNVEGKPLWSFSGQTTSKQLEEQIEKYIK